MYSVLVIDGEHDVKIQLRKELVKEGFKVYYSDKARSGLGKARDKNPDVIITELMFSDYDGFDLIKEIRSDLKLMYTPMIVLSSRANDFDKVLALELGADDYVIKPAGVREIAARIRVQLRYVRKKAVEVESRTDQWIGMGM